MYIDYTPIPIPAQPPSQPFNLKNLGAFRCARSHCARSSRIIPLVFISRMMRGKCYLSWPVVRMVFLGAQVGHRSDVLEQIG